MHSHELTSAVTVVRAHIIRFAVVIRFSPLSQFADERHVRPARLIAGTLEPAQIVQIVIEDDIEHRARLEQRLGEERVGYSYRDVVSELRPYIHFSQKLGAWDRGVFSIALEAGRIATVDVTLHLNPRRAVRQPRERETPACRRSRT